MRHRVHGRHLGRPTAHRLSLYRNLVTDLVRYERITTTEAKAKEIRPMAERMVTLGRRGDLHARRQAMRFIYSEKVVKHLFDNIAPRMKDRPGGYLRITKLEPRKGDGAAMATIEFVDYGGTVVSMPRPARVTSAPSTARVTAPAAAPSTIAPAAAATVVGSAELDDEPVAEVVTAETEEAPAVEAEATADVEATTESEDTSSSESADTEDEAK